MNQFSLHGLGVFLGLSTGMTGATYFICLSTSIGEAVKETNTFVREKLTQSVHISG